MGDGLSLVARFRITVVAAAITLLGCTSDGPTINTSGGGGQGGGQSGPGPNQVFMEGLQFDPSTRIVQSGAIVQWVNHDTLTHTVVLDSGPDSLFDSGDILPGASFTHHFGALGTYAYHCRIHGSPGSGMAGTVVVQ